MQFRAQRASQQRQRHDNLLGLLLLLLLLPTAAIIIIIIITFPLLQQTHDRKSLGRLLRCPVRGTRWTRPRRLLPGRPLSGATFSSKSTTSRLNRLLDDDDFGVVIERRAQFELRLESLARVQNVSRELRFDVRSRFARTQHRRRTSSSSVRFFCDFYDDDLRCWSRRHVYTHHARDDDDASAMTMNAMRNKRAHMRVMRTLINQSGVPSSFVMRSMR